MMNKPSNTPENIISANQLDGHKNNKYTVTQKLSFFLFQGSVAIQTALAGLTISTPVANFLQCICAKITNIGCHHEQLFQQ